MSSLPRDVRGVVAEFLGEAWSERALMQPERVCGTRVVGSLRLGGLVSSQVALRELNPAEWHVPFGWYGSDGSCENCGLLSDYFDESDYGGLGFPAFNGSNPYRRGRSYSCVCCSQWCVTVHEQDMYRLELANAEANERAALRDAMHAAAHP